jgi:hypothetical protein
LKSGKNEALNFLFCLYKNTIRVHVGLQGPDVQEIVLRIDILYYGGRRSATYAMIHLKNDKCGFPGQNHIFNENSQYNTIGVTPFDAGSIDETLNGSLGEEKISKITKELGELLSRAYRFGIAGGKPDSVLNLVSDFRKKLEIQFDSILK